MKTKFYFPIIFILLLFVSTAAAGTNPKDELKKYFNDAAQKVKQTNDPAEKRLILNKTYGRVLTALDILNNYPFLSKEEKKGIQIYRTTALDKYNELNGLNGYTRVDDNNLDRFANYSVQSIEQANTLVISISVTTLLIILLIILLLKP